jgi:hypothetical protein
MRPADINRGTNRPLLRSHTRGRRRDVNAHPRTYMRPLRNGQRTAAIVLAASWRSLELGIVGSAIVHRLPHAASVQRRRGDRQSHWDENAHQQQYQQQSGNKTVHKSYSDYSKNNSSNKPKVVKTLSLLASDAQLIFRKPVGQPSQSVTI